MKKRNGKIVKCDNCGTEKYKDPCKLKRDKNNFCSKKCFDVFRLNRMIVSCYTCHKDIEIVPSRIKSSKKFFCSQECMTIGFTGVNHSGFFKKGNKGEKCINYNGGTQIYNGYLAILLPEHPFANKRGYIYEHRIIMEKRIGRYLTTQEVVHHINFNKKDNSDENLMLFSTDEEHRKYHSILRKEERLKNGFASPELRLKTYKTYNYQKWRESVVSRDDRTCVICGSKDKIHADHIKPLVFILKENNITSIESAKLCTELWDINNGRTLCAKCHRDTESWGTNNH